MKRPGSLRGRASASAMLSVSVLLLAQLACLSAGTEEVAEVVTPSPSVTPAPFYPTITPVPSPTELPPVTPPTAAPTLEPSATPTRDPSEVTIIMEPNLGEVGVDVRLDAYGFVPGSTVTLHWTRHGTPPAGDPVRTVEADDEGQFSVTLRVPATWSGGLEERDLLELRAVGEEGREAWATYTYVVPFRAFVSPGNTYTNTAHGYSVDLPPGWTAQEADPTNVTFGPEGEAHASFIRVLSGSDLDAAIDELMAEVAAGLSYDVEEGKLGSLDGKRVVVPDDGRTYWFLAHSGRTYALHFVADDETVAEFTYTTFRFTN